MARVLAFNVLFFLLPFALYALLLLARRGNIGTAADWPIRIIVWLTVAGAVVMTTALLVFVQFEGAAPGTTYHPAERRDGQIVPGEFVPAPKPGTQ